jgi:hypothetical protein
VATVVTVVIAAPAVTAVAVTIVARAAMAATVIVAPAVKAAIATVVREAKAVATAARAVIAKAATTAPRPSLRLRSCATTTSNRHCEAPANAGVEAIQKQEGPGAIRGLFHTWRPKPDRSKELDDLWPAVGASRQNEIELDPSRVSMRSCPALAAIISLSYSPYIVP